MKLEELLYFSLIFPLFLLYFSLISPLFLLYFSFISPLHLLYFRSQSCNGFTPLCFFFVSVMLLHTKSMNNFKIHKLLKKKHPEIFYIFLFQVLSMYIFYRIKRWTKMLEFMDFTYGTISLNQSHIGWLCKWTIKIELRYDLNTMLASIFHRNLSRQV